MFRQSRKVRENDECEHAVEDEPEAKNDRAIHIAERSTRRGDQRSAKRDKDKEVPAATLKPMTIVAIVPTAENGRAMRSVAVISLLATLPKSYQAD